MRCTQRASNGGPLVGGVTLPCQFRWGQGALFGTGRFSGHPVRYRVADGCTWGPSTTSLALATAQARAVVLAGRAALVWADDGTSVTVTWTPAAGFAVVTSGPVPWASACQSLLDRHG